MNKVFVAGHNGMVGRALVRQLSRDNQNEIVTAERKSLDLTDQTAVRQFFDRHKIDEVYLAAAKVGGIHANNIYPAEFIYENLMIEANIINSAHLSNVNKLLFLGSSCIYPKHAEQPINETALLSGKLEATNEPYAIAKIAGIKLCECYSRQYDRDYRSVMPSNLYGPFDNFHLENSHVIPALMRRLHDAKVSKGSIVEIWGSGNPKREFLFVDDMAEGCVFIMNMTKQDYQNTLSDDVSHLNIGTGTDCSINDLVKLVSKVVGYDGEHRFDKSKPDGTPRKLMDVSKFTNAGWKAKTSLKDGLTQTYEWFLANATSYRQ
jgi:GDP-L-fucose synthase